MKQFDRRWKWSLIVVMLVPGLCGFHWWDPFAKWIGIGNESLESGDLDSAEAAYQKAGEAVAGDERVSNNMGLVEFSRGKYDEAMKLFQTAAAGGDQQIKGTAHYNRGCANLQKGDLKGAEESFIEALRANPADEDAKANLEMTLQMLQQMPTPTPNPQDDSNQDQQAEPSGTPDAPTTTPEASETQKPEEQSSEGTPTQTPQESSDPSLEPTPTPSAIATAQPAMEQEETPMPTPEEGKMNMQEAERLLDAQEEEEMDVRRRFHQLPPVKDRTIEKDW